METALAPPAVIVLQLVIGFWLDPGSRSDRGAAAAVERAVRAPNNGPVSLLSLLLLTPVAAAALIWLWPRKRAARVLALAAAAPRLALAAAVVAAFDAADRASSRSSGVNGFPR
ncbi:MAG: hypothetical protein IPI02_11140 [Sterolibacteriaceae bacterium]|nr:hypothetical protein [Sterolibacteriaceae bacterium]